MKLALLFVIFSLSIFAQSFSINDLSWMEGTWKDTMKFGGIATEVNHSPSSGVLMGMFKLEKDNKVLALEFYTFIQIGDTVKYYLRHFNNDLTPWEEGKAIEMILVEAKNNSFKFENFIHSDPKFITITRHGNNSYNTIVEIINEGKSSILDLTMKKVKP